MYVVRDKGVDDGYRALADAIIIQAAKDYRKALMEDARGMCREIEWFFRSEWFGLLTAINPEMLIRKLREEVKTK